MKKNTSATDLEETCPLGSGNRQYEIDHNGKTSFAENNAIRHEIYETDQNGKISFAENNVFRYDTEDDSDKTNGDMKCNGVELKINILMIEYGSKDKINKSLSTVDIEALQNGTTINETTYINNTGSESIETDILEEEPGSVTLDNETVFLVS